MKTIFVASCAAIAGCVSGSVNLSDSQHQYLFTSFVATHGKQYESKHFFDKYAVFRRNLEHILAHNSRGNSKYTLGVNQFADKTQAEFATMHKFKPLFRHLHKQAARFGQKTQTRGLPEQVDWREQKVNGVPVLGPVPNQGQCGSCWAFSTTGALEARAVINGKPLVKLSEQELVDCAGTKYGNNGCEGGLMSSAYNYYRDHGAVADKDYPYTGKDGACNADKLDKLYTNKQFVGYQALMGKDALRAALAQQPISVALAASSMDFQFYKSGVLDSARCGSGDDVNHAVVAVGYAVAERDPVTGTDGHYIIRNSWGESWGDHGHIKIASGADTCGLEGHGFNIQPLLD